MSDPRELIALILGYHLGGSEGAARQAAGEVIAALTAAGCVILPPGGQIREDWCVETRIGSSSAGVDSGLPSAVAARQLAAAMHRANEENRKRYYFADSSPSTFRIYQQRVTKWVDGRVHYEPPTHAEALADVTTRSEGDRR